MSFGNARTTAGARLCSPPMTIGIFPARTTSAAIGALTSSALSCSRASSFVLELATPERCDVQDSPTGRERGLGLSGQGVFDRSLRRELHSRGDGAGGEAAMRTSLSDAPAAPL